MRSRLLAVAALLTLSAAVPASAVSPGVTGASVLALPMDARAMGMGGAFAAVCTDASSLFYNPAGLARLNAQEIGGSFASGLVDNSLEQFSYAGPLPFTGFSGNGYASAGARLLFASNGSIEVNLLNADGSLQSSQNMNAGSDFVATAGYAERMGTSFWDLESGSYGVNHYVGASAKYVRSSLAGGYSAQAAAADLGYLAHSSERGLSLGASLLNIGTKMKFVSVGDPLPLTARGGVAYQFRIPAGNSLIVAVDGEYHVYEKQILAEAGAEYFLLKSYGLRLGYQFLRDSVGLTVGFGLRWRGRVLIDYAWGMSNTLGDTQRISLTYRFAGVPASIRGRQRQQRLLDTTPGEAEPSREQSSPIEIPPNKAAPSVRPEGLPGWIY